MSDGIRNNFGNPLFKVKIKDQNGEEKYLCLDAADDADPRWKWTANASSAAEFDAEIAGANDDQQVLVGDRVGLKFGNNSYLAVRDGNLMEVNNSNENKWYVNSVEAAGDDTYVTSVCWADRKGVHSLGVKTGGDSVDLSPGALCSTGLYAKSGSQGMTFIWGVAHDSDRTKLNVECRYGGWHHTDNISLAEIPWGDTRLVELKQEATNESISAGGKVSAIWLGCSYIVRFHGSMERPGTLQADSSDTNPFIAENCGIIVAASLVG